MPEIPYTFHQLRVLLTRLRPLARRRPAGAFTLAEVETALQDAGMVELNLATCRELLMSLRSSDVDPEDPMDGLGLGAIIVAFSRGPLGITPADVVALARIGLARARDADVFESIAFHEIDQTVSARGLRSVNVKNLRSVIEQIAVMGGVDAVDPTGSEARSR